MKVVVVGANGQIGNVVVDLLQSSKEYTVRAMVRKEEQKQAFLSNGIETIVANLEDSVENLKKVFVDCDAVVFAAGSGPKTGYDKTLLIDLDGAAKTVEAAEEAGVKRFMMLSAFQADNRENWNESIKPYYVAKHYADKVVLASNMNYTIIRPGGLVNEEPTGKISAGDSLERGTITRKDVAHTIVTSLLEEHTYNRAFDIIQGNVPIATALKNI